MCSMDLGNRVYGFATATATAATDFPVLSRHTTYRPIQAKFCLHPSEVEGLECGFCCCCCRILVSPAVSPAPEVVAYVASLI